VSHLYTNPVDWFKNSLKWCKNSSFKVESYTPPPPPQWLWGSKILGDGNNEKRRKWFSLFLIFNFNK